MEVHIGTHLLCLVKICSQGPLSGCSVAADCITLSLCSFTIAKSHGVRRCTAPDDNSRVISESEDVCAAAFYCVNQAKCSHTEHSAYTNLKGR